jgi:hypothetical protein
VEAKPNTSLQINGFTATPATNNQSIGVTGATMQNNGASSSGVVTLKISFPQVPNTHMAVSPGVPTGISAGWTYVTKTTNAPWVFTFQSTDKVAPGPSSPFAATFPITKNGNNQPSSYSVTASATASHCGEITPVSDGVW